MSSPLTLWTVGHSNHEFGGFAPLLRSEEIEFLVDVRSFPYSRFAPHFNREELEASIGRLGLRYLFLGAELGGRPTSEDQYDAEGHALYGPMSEKVSFKAAIDRLIAGARRHRIALVCSEGDPHDCHRRLLVGRVLANRGVTLRHILPDGSVLTENCVELAEPSPQESLFGAGERPWRSVRPVSHKRRLSTTSIGGE